MMDKKKGALILSSGEIFWGTFIGDHERAGEVVFNTSHSGYEEIATDPSYMNQIMVMTASMQGNYGVDSEVWESSRFWIQGFVCLQLQQSHRDSSWCQRLLDQKVGILTNVDTRQLVLRLRQGGTTWGALVFGEDPVQLSERAMALIEQSRDQDSDWVYRASRSEILDLGGFGSRGRAAVLDLGSKQNILREVCARFQEVRVFPARSSVDEILAYKPECLFLSNGPGDPAQVELVPEHVRSLIGRLPMMGICMGHQILALALGARTERLKFGHRGSNHPIRDLLLDRIYMTAQNHGYVVTQSSLPAEVRVTHTNLNDQSVAGFFAEKQCLLGVQFHPESRPGPHESSALFDWFVERL